MVDYTPRGRLAHVRLAGKALAGDLHDAITAATLELSTAEVSQLTMTARDDQGLRLLRRLDLTVGDDRRPGTLIGYADLDFELRALDVATGPSFTLTARSLGTAKLKRARGGKVWRDLSPTDLARQEARAAGLAFIGQPTPHRHHIARKAAQKGQAAESTFDVLIRLAQEEGYVCFEAAGVLYFATPTYLVTHATERLGLTWSGAGTDPRIRDVPTCRRSGDDTGRAATVSVELLGELGDDARPGNALDLDGVPGFTSAYRVTGVTLDVNATTAVTVNAETPINPKPQPAMTSKDNPEKPTKAKSTVKRKTPSTTDSSGGPARQPASSPAHPAPPAPTPWEDRQA